MRNILMVILVGIVSLTLVSCRDFLTDHSINLDGAEHGEKLYSGAKNCTVCHGTNLQGNGPVPSCYSCHEALWSSELHEKDRGGVHHRGGFQAETECGACHGGASLQGSRSRPSCYECHEDNWTALSIHTVEQDGVFHGAGLETPVSNCSDSSCHASDLRGSEKGPSCYQCHGQEWDDEGSDSILHIIKKKVLIMPRG